MNAIHPITKPCRTVQQWLKRHGATKCPTAYALGLSAMEKHFGVSPTPETWRERAKNRAKNEVAARKQKHLHSGKKSPK